MLGWINQSIEAFITTAFGVEVWDQVVETAEVQASWVSSCPYSDKITYDLVVAAAGILGVSVNDALEAYGKYFIQHVQGEGYTKLLQVLGANIAEFLQNLNNLHLHLSYCWPDMLAPAFRCEQVTPESLLLHYNSMRPGLWPIVVGVLKGVASEFFNLQLEVELLQSRHAGDCDHEVFRLRYPYQEDLRSWGDTSAAAQSSMFSMPQPLFYTLHPFHVIMDEKMQLLQWGPALNTAVPGLRVGQNVRTFFKCKHPGHVQLDYQQICLHTNNCFVLQARNSVLTLKGQMLPTTTSQPSGEPARVLVYLASPRVRSVAEMQQSGIYFSDIPLHDMTQDYILLAEQRHAEADLKEKYEKLTLELKAANEKLARTTANLEEEKARAEALLYRMSGLIACFPCGAGENPSQLAAMVECQSQAAQLVGQPTGSISCSLVQTSAHDRIEAVRQELVRANITTSEQSQVQCLELLGQGTYGKVYKGLWKGSIVAVKTIVLPSAMSGQEKREKMAIMEAAISSALSHPNIMQTYTYDIQPLKDNSRGSDQQLLMIGGSTTTNDTSGTSSSRCLTAPDPTGAVHSFEVMLICEYCDRGSLREALDLGGFKLPDGAINYPAVLDTAIEIATAVLHLHDRNVLHSDLKARNIMLKSSGSEGRGITAKVADFGLAVKMDHMETHLSNAFQGTMTHMAPEIMIKGHISKESDVYALGMVLWELYTAKHVFRGIPRALLGHQITLLHKRPEFPPDAPESYVKLTQQCWDPNPAKRPSLDIVLEVLQTARAALRCPTQPLTAYDIETHLIRKHSMAQSPTPKAAAGSKGTREPRASRGSNSALHAALREQELKRLEQQQQQRLKQHRPRRVTSTSSLGSYSPRKALDGRQQGQAGAPHLRTAVSDADAASAALATALASGSGTCHSPTGRVISGRHVSSSAGRTESPLSDRQAPTSADAVLQHEGSLKHLAASGAATDVGQAYPAQKVAGTLEHPWGGQGATAGAATGASGGNGINAVTNSLSSTELQTSYARLGPGTAYVDMYSSEQLGEDEEHEKSFYLEHSESTAGTGWLGSHLQRTSDALAKAAYVKHGDGLADTRERHWQELLQLQELSCDTMATHANVLPGGYAGMSAAAAAALRARQQEQVRGSQAEASAPASGVSGGRCPFGHGAVAAAGASTAASGGGETSGSPAAVPIKQEQKQHKQSAT